MADQLHDSTFTPWTTRGGRLVRTGPCAWSKLLRWNERLFWDCNKCGWRGESKPLLGAGFHCGGCGAYESLKATRRRVFCASLADWLDNEVPIEWLADMLELIRKTPNLDWILQTKHIGNWRTRLIGIVARVTGWPDEPREELKQWVQDWLNGNPPSNIWLGATICNQEEADRDEPKLARVPARVRFLSIEPMLSAIDLMALNIGDLYWLNALTGQEHILHDGGMPSKGPFGALNWIICSGETGPSARPLHPEWVRGLRDQCAAAGVPFRFEGWGSYCHPSQMPDDCDGSGGFVDDFFKVGKRTAGRLLDGVEHNGGRR